MSNVYRIIVICFLILGLIFIGGTIYGLFFHSTPKENTQIKTNILLEDGQERGQGQTFTGIGLLRVLTADPQPGTVMIHVLFNYYPEDKAFSEELALRVRGFREIITGYIGSFSIKELQILGEDVIKTEILHRFNAILRLGRIETVYFSEFMIVD